MKDDLGNRMKSYEKNSKALLMRKIPVIIRVDGKSFHRFCKRFEKPYDLYFNTYMNAVMKYLCENIQGAKFAERHSDEISILVTDMDSIHTDAYFGYQVQKISSIVSSMATAELCRQMMQEKIDLSHVGCLDDWVDNPNYLSIYEDWPSFDCRCFNLPISEVENYFWWRLKDAVRNSINMLAQSKFSHKELQGVSCDQMQEMLFSKCGINWNNLNQGQKSGFLCFKTSIKKVVEKGPNAGLEFDRNEWTINYSPSSMEMFKNIIKNILTD